jgi:hypothetical protein
MGNSWIIRPSKRVLCFEARVSGKETIEGHRDFSFSCFEIEITPDGLPSAVWCPWQGPRSFGEDMPVNTASSKMKGKNNSLYLIIKIYNGNVNVGNAPRTCCYTSYRQLTLRPKYARRRN